MSLNKRLVGTAATVAVACGALAAVPAATAATGEAAYACTSTPTGAFTGTVVVDASPDTVAAGAPIAVTTKITLPDPVRQALYDAGGRNVDGTAQLAVTGPASARTVNHTVAKEPIPETGTVTLTGTGSTTIAESGDVALAAGALSSTLQLHAGGSPVGTPITVTCTAPAPAPVIDTVSVTATSTSTLLVDPVRAGYGEKVLVRATVATTGGPAKGNVLFTLGSATRRIPVKGDGTAEATLPALVNAKQAHPVTAVFEPTDAKNVTGSTASGQVSVVKAGTDVKVFVPTTRRGRAVKAVVGINSVYGAKANGRVRVILKKDGKTLRQKTKSLRNEKRTVWLSRPWKLGQHTVIVKYLGTANLRKSSDRTTFRVVRR